jgi:hypothetical protein
LLLARGHNRFLAIHIAVAAFELGLEFHFELTKIDQVPAGKSPPVAGPSPFRHHLPDLARDKLAADDQLLFDREARSSGPEEGEDCVNAEKRKC